MSHISREHYPRLRYAAAGYSGCSSSGLTRWQQCVYDVREPPIQPSLINVWESGENDLNVQWSVVDCSDQRASRTAFILLQITENGTGNGMFSNLLLRQCDSVKSWSLELVSRCFYTIIMAPGEVLSGQMTHAHLWRIPLLLNLTLIFTWYKYRNWDVCLHLKTAREQKLALVLRCIRFTKAAICCHDCRLPPTCIDSSALLRAHLP